jgi:hypothetical protein
MVQLNDFLVTITTEDGGLKDGSRVVKLLQRMVQSKSAFEVEKRERMLDILLVCWHEEETGKRPGRDWEETGKRLGRDWEETGKRRRQLLPCLILALGTGYG